MYRRLKSLFVPHPAPEPEPLFYGMRVIVLSGVFQGKEATVRDEGFGGYLLRIELGNGKAQYEYVKRSEIKIKPM